MTWESRHRLTRKRARSFDLNVQKVYDELPEASKREIDATAEREARLVLDREQLERGSMTLSVYRCEIELEKREQWEALVLKGCASRLQELATQDKGDDGPEERLEWALLRTQLARKPDCVRPRTIAEWLTRYMAASAVELA